jgi:hypothetical protein
MLRHQRDPLTTAGDTRTRQRALEDREYRSRFSGEHAADPPTEAETHVISRTPDEQKAECEAWNTRRYGEAFHRVRDMDRDDLIAEGYASYHATGNGGYETAEETHTTNHEQPAESDTMAPTAGESEALPVHLGAYHDTPLDVHAGVVATAACYVVIDGTAWNGKHKPAEYYMSWYGDQYGAEQRMKSSSIARAFQHIPGEEPPEIRAHDMVRDLQNQGVATSNHKLGSRGHHHPEHD